MNKSMASDAEYEVGRGRPPKDSQFKKGQSGNPAGRKKGSRNFSTIVREALEEEVTVQGKDGEHRMTRLEAIVLRAITSALSGDVRMIQFWLQNAQHFVGEPEESRSIPAEDQAVIDRLIERKAQTAGPGTRSNGR